MDLAGCAGLKPASVICEILKNDGTMARRDDLVEFTRENRLKILTVADISNTQLNSRRTT